MSDERAAQHGLERSLDRWLQELRNARPSRLGLSVMTSLLKEIGSPEQIPCVHVAGTNGKGSVCWKVAHALQSAGYRVGLYTSPHISSFRERIQIQGQPCSKEMWYEALHQVYLATRAIHPCGEPPGEALPSCGELPGEALPHAPLGSCAPQTPRNEAKTPMLLPSLFEVWTAMSWIIFRMAQVDIAVVEVGLGGRLDATNLCAPLVTVITSIDLDHQALLGGTRELIAAEKAGIIKAGIPVVVGPEARYNAIRNRAAEQRAPLLEILSHSEDYDQQNSLIAATALQALPMPIPAHAVTHGSSMRPPCRCETVETSIHGRPVTAILDVAHNPHGVRALVRKLGQLCPALPYALAIDHQQVVPGYQHSSAESRGAQLSSVCGGAPPPKAEHLQQACGLEQGFEIILGASKEKDLPQMLQELQPLGRRIWVVEAHHERAWPAHDIAQLAQSAGYEAIACASVEEAILCASESGQPLLVLGTFFIMSEARQVLGLSDLKDPTPLYETVCKPAQ